VDANAFAVDVGIDLDEEHSVNPPYFFSISAFAILVSDQDVPRELALTVANATGFTMLVGAIREHLASVTARGPWDQFLLGPVTFPQSPAPIVRSPDAPDDSQI
jgi:hypothetical protein